MYTKEYPTSVRITYAQYLHPILSYVEQHASFSPFDDISARELLHLLLQHRTAVGHYKLTVLGGHLGENTQNIHAGR